MPKIKPIHRKVLIQKLIKLGFSSPYAASKHQFVINKSGKKIFIPNPHKKDIDIPYFVLDVEWRKILLIIILTLKLRS